MVIWSLEIIQFKEITVALSQPQGLNPGTVSVLLLWEGVGKSKCISVPCLVATWNASQMSWELNITSVSLCSVPGGGWFLVHCDSKVRTAHLPSPSNPKCPCPLARGSETQSRFPSPLWFCCATFFKPYGLPVPQTLLCHRENDFWPLYTGKWRTIYRVLLSWPLPLPELPTSSSHGHSGASLSTSIGIKASFLTCFEVVLLGFRIGNFLCFSLSPHNSH